MLQKLLHLFWSDKYRAFLLVLLVFLVIFSICSLRPKIAGDSFMYVDSIKVLTTGVQPEGFTPMKIISTYLGLELIIFLNFFIKNIAISWLLLNSFLYIVMGLFFYSLLKRIINDEKVAFIGTIFLATNYAAITFGLGYLMDMGGWAFYVASIYFSYRYLEGEVKSDKWIYISSAIIGVGGLCKEYAFVAYVVTLGAILWKNWRNFRKIFFTIITTGCMVFIPFLLMNAYTFFAFNGYTYLDWYLYNKNTYTYQNRIVEFIKSFGSIYNFGWFLFVGGFYLLLKRYKETLKDKKLIFIWLVILSCSAILIWPVVTRVLFITMPAVVLVSCLFIKQISTKWWIIAPILILYVFSAYLMDAFVLNFVNLPF